MRQPAPPRPRLPSGRRLLAALAIAVLASGCAEHFTAASLGVPAVMARAAGDTTTGTPFKVRSTSVHFFLGIFTLSRANLERALATQLVGGQGVADVKITVRSRWSDFLVTALTLGLVVPRTVTFEGVILGGQPTPPPAP